MWGNDFNLSAGACGNVITFRLVLSPMEVYSACMDWVEPVCSDVLLAYHAMSAHWEVEHPLLASARCFAEGKIQGDGDMV